MIQVARQDIQHMGFAARQAEILISSLPLPNQVIALHRG